MATHETRQPGATSGPGRPPSGAGRARPAGGSRALRADAARNRAAVIEAATELFADRGLDAPLDEIAARAGVGNATLYRHFPARWALIAAVFAGQMEQYTEVIETAAAQPDPGPALRSCVTGIGELQAGSRGLAELLATTDLSDGHLDALRSRSYRALVALIRRATRAGAARPDLRPQDVALLMVANAGLIARTADDAPGASARLVAVWLDGIAAPAATPGPPPPPERQLLAAMRRHAP
jgi:AcrR family transcriptional regulator